MKFLVLGASGMAGHLLSIYLKEQGHVVIGFARKNLDYVDTIVGDIGETGKLQNLIKSGNFDIVINAVGILNHFAEENHEQAAYVNAYFPHLLANMTENIKTQIIHISTDCVFSGEKAPYFESSLRDGKTFYDRSKAFGELEDNKNLTLRNSIVGPDMRENGIGLLNWFMKQEAEVDGYIYAMWTGLTTLELARVIEKAAVEKICGLINMVPDTNISKYALLKLFNHYLRNNEIVILPKKEVKVNKTLVRTNYKFSYCVPDYETMVAELAVWIKQHRELYPHYHLK